MLEVMDTLYERGELPPQVTPEFWREYYHCWTPFNPEYVKIVLDELAVKAGVEVRFYTRVIDADIDGKRVNGVVVAQVDGYRYISAKTFIDATGDAILSDICGIPYREAGRDTEKIMPATMTAIQTTAPNMVKICPAARSISARASSPDSTSRCRLLATPSSNRCFTWLTSAPGSTLAMNKVALSSPK